MQGTKVQKRERGITLIALVVTVIVLLILAGISIMMLTGQSGILNQARAAKEDTRGGEVKEAVALAVSENTMADYTENGTRKSRQKVIDELHAEGKLTDEEVTWLEENDQITIGSIEVDFSALGKVGALTLVEMYDKAIEDGCTNEDGSCQNEEHLHIGDYVNYKKPTSGTYTVQADELGLSSWEGCPLENKTQIYDVSKNQLNWRVLGKDSKTGGIKLIAGSPMKSNNKIEGAEYPYLFMYGAKAYTNSVQELNKICELYNTDIGKGRSVTQEDINQVIGIKTDDDIKKYNLISAMNSGVPNYKETYNFSNQFTPETWLESSHTPGKISGTVTGYRFIIMPKEGIPGISSTRQLVKIASTKNIAASSMPPIVTVENTRVYNMLFDNVEYGSSQGKCYWLASLGVIALSDSANFGSGVVGSVAGMAMTDTDDDLFCSDGSEGKDAFAVRPVVYLKSSVTSEQVSKIGDKAEEDWNYTLPSSLQPPEPDEQ